VDIFTGREYEALSYTWGMPIEGSDEEAPGQPWIVLICEVVSLGFGLGELAMQSLKVSSMSTKENLAGYLRAVVSRHQAMNVGLAYEIWIDTICIDQNNIKEKSLQAALMGDVYVKC
jgi:hypothetical protein